MGDPRACRIAQCRTKKIKKKCKTGPPPACVFLLLVSRSCLGGGVRSAQRSESKAKREHFFSGQFGDWVFLLLETTRTKHPITPPTPSPSPSPLLHTLPLHEEKREREEKRGGYMIQPTGKNREQNGGERERLSLFFLFLFSCFLPTQHTIFTDLSAAGRPAKLKHIAQRRKRKQP